MYILDLETDGLMPECTVIHCAVIYDTKTGGVTKFEPHQIKDLPAHLDTLPQMSCHNGIGFDLKVLKKVLNYDYKGIYVDTLLLSRILFPDLDNASYQDDDGDIKGVKNPHSIESWGIRFGISKPVHEDWSKFTPEMLHRCTEDTKIQGKLWEHLRATMKDYTVRDSRIANAWKSIINMEQKTWKLIEEQADYGWAFDLQRAYELVDELSGITGDIENKLVPILPITVIQVAAKETKAFNANGSPSANASNWLGDRIGDLVGDFSKVSFKPFNIRSSQQVKDYLLSKGWTPTEWNYKKDKHNKPVRDERRQLIPTSPKVPKTAEQWDEIGQRLNSPDIALLAEYNKASHRLSQVQGLIRNVRPDHRISAQANTCSTNTARMTHRVVVNIPKADPTVYYGKQLRSLFIAGEGKVLVGCDAAALEARCEAHYVYKYDMGAAHELIAGDIHTANAAVFGTTRQVAKGGKYAILYGCSPQKLATTIGKPLAQAQEIYNSYWDANEGLKQLKADLEAEYNTYGYILGIDGRPLTIRYKHAIINTMLQSCGSIAMKYALCIADKWLKREQIDYHFVGNFHDEIQVECREKFADDIGKVMVDSIREAGRLLKLNVELDGEYKIGRAWDETH